MAPIKFSYFDLEALGECVRLALAQSGVEWIDDRVAFEDWPALKPTLPYGKLPVLEVDGTVIPQSTSQLRYVGKIGGLYPTDPLEAALADAAVGATMDIFIPMAAAFNEKDDERKMQMQKDMAENSIPAWCANVEKALKSAGGQFFAGGKLSIGDLAVVGRLNNFRNGAVAGTPTTIVDDYPLLISLIERVMAEPKIAAYMEALPEKK